MLICANPRGSKVQNRRKLSSTVLRWVIFSSIVSHGTSSIPPVMHLPISPSACASTIVRVLVHRIGLLLTRRPGNFYPRHPIAHPHR